MRKCWRSTSLCLDAHRLSERLIGLWLLTSCEISRAVRAQPNLIYNTPLLGLGQILHFLSFFGSLRSFGLLFQALIIYVHQFLLLDFAPRLCELSTVLISFSLCSFKEFHIHILKAEWSTIMLSFMLAILFFLPSLCFLVLAFGGIVLELTLCWGN